MCRFCPEDHDDLRCPDVGEVAFHPDGSIAAVSLARAGGPTGAVKAFLAAVDPGELNDRAMDELEEHPDATFGENALRVLIGMADGG